MTGDGSGDGRRDVTPALVMFPLSVVVCMALALECFRVDLPDIEIGVAGLRGAPPLWITVVSAAIVAVLTLRIVLRGRRGHDVAAWELWVVAGLAVLGLTVTLTAIAGWSTDHVVARDVANAPVVALSPGRLLYLGAGAMSAIAAGALGWLRQITA